jgi:hypothetical protein
MAITEVCGWECRIVTGGAAASPDEKHWDSITGVPAISTSTVRTGTAALRINPSAATLSLRKTIARRLLTMQVYFRFAVLPGANANFIRLVNASGTPVVACDNAGVITLKLGAGTASASLGTISTNTWYRLDLKVDTSGATATMTGKIDGGTEQTSSVAQTAANMTEISFGFSSAATCDVFFDDFIAGDTITEYPYGAGTVERMKPTRDGTHSFTAGDFGYDTAGANVGTSDTTVYTYVDDDDLTSITDGVLIRQKVVRSTGYVEVGFGSAPHSWDAQAVNVVSSWHASTTGANTVGLKMNDGGTIAAMTDAAGDALSDFSNATVTFAEKIVVTPPSGGTWTTAKIAAVLLRMGYSTDVLGIPYWDGAMLEVAYGPDTSAVTGSGGVTIPAPSISGTGSEGFTGSGGVTIPAPSIAGTGAESFTGSGGVIIPAPSIAAEGTHTEGGGSVTGSGGVTIPAPAISGSGEEGFTGSGGVTIPAPVISGSGAEGFTGSGGVTIPAPAIAGTGQQVENVTGSGGVSIPAPSIAGTGQQVQNVTGSGGVAIPAPSISGTGTGGEPPAEQAPAGDTSGYPPVDPDPTKHRGQGGKRRRAAIEAYEAAQADAEAVLYLILLS